MDIFFQKNFIGILLQKFGLSLTKVRTFIYKTTDFYTIKLQTFVNESTDFCVENYRFLYEEVCMLTNCLIIRNFKMPMYVAGRFWLNNKYIQLTPALL